MDEEILVTVEVSAPRRWLGIAMLAGLGALVIYVALAAPPEPAWQAFLVVTGLGALWMAEKMRRATASRLELTREELRDSLRGRIVAIRDLEHMDRGFFAMKPSNGFLLRAAGTGTRAWAPGLWWRLGRRIGVGGVTAAAQTKAMSEVLAALMAERRAQDDQAS
ncbi:MAG TPA: hypothetical protein DEA05_14040 [Rhodobacteraceae bacterium]|nr:hypothetical protein [Paracoccaceae bacterium]